MKLYHLAVLTGLITVALTASDVMAQYRRRPDPNAADQVPSPFRGVVVSASAGSVSVKGEIGQPHREGQADNDPNKDPNQGSHEKNVRTIHFTVRSDTKLTRDGQPITAADIKKDEPIQVTFSTKEGSTMKHVTEVAVGKLPEGEGEKGEGKPKGKGKKPKN